MHGAAGEGDVRLICESAGLWFSFSLSLLSLFRLISGASRHSGNLDLEPSERSGVFEQTLFFCSNITYHQKNGNLVCGVFQSNVVRHHWVHRRRQTGKCRQCGKVPVQFKSSEAGNCPQTNRISHYQQGFQQKFTFHSKEIVAISCSWCKQAVSPTTAQERASEIQNVGGK